MYLILSIESFEIFQSCAKSWDGVVACRGALVECLGMLHALLREDSLRRART